MTRRRLTVTALRAGRPRRTVRLRLTLWSGGLFLICGTVLLAVTYGLAVQAFIGNSAGNTECRAPGSGCSTIGPQQARATALQENAAVLHELLTRSEIAIAITAAFSVALGWFIAGRVLQPLRTITVGARSISAASLGERLALQSGR